MERSGFTIRPFESQDRIDVIALVEENGLTKGVYGFLEPIIENADVLVAEKQGQVVGTVIVEDDTEHFNASCVQYLVVEPAHRGANIGKSLMNHAENLMRERNKATVVVYPLESKPEVIDFYKGLGYVHNAPKLKKKL